MLAAPHGSEPGRGPFHPDGDAGTPRDVVSEREAKAMHEQLQWRHYASSAECYLLNPEDSPLSVICHNPTLGAGHGPHFT
jgi:hypothetical protein